METSERFVDEYKHAYAERVERAITLLQGKWTVQILCVMRERPVRLGQLRRLIPGASKKALTANLRSLEAEGIVVRRDLSSSVLHVEYEISEAARGSLFNLLDHLAKSVSVLRLPQDSLECQRWRLRQSCNSGDIMEQGWFL